MMYKAYAKINLTLNVLNKREDGYHNLKSVMIPIDLYDELYFELSDEYILESNYNIAVENNIITKVFNIFKNRYNIGNVKIKLIKNIPDKAGLGGGSSDATTTIKGLNDLFELNLDIKEQEEIALLVGSDTLFTLHSKPAIVTGRGDEISFIDCNLDFDILLIKPNYGFSTKDIFNNKDIINTKHNDNIVSYLKDNNINMIEEKCYNSFLNTILNSNEEFSKLFNKINNYNKASLSGSGSTIFLISDNNKLLKDISLRFKENYTKLVKPLNK